MQMISSYMLVICLKYLIVLIYVTTTYYMSVSGQRRMVLV